MSGRGLGQGPVGRAVRKLADKRATRKPKDQGIIDAQEKRFSPQQFEELIAEAPRSGARPLLEQASFRKVTFEGAVDFKRAIFKNGADFHEAHFNGVAHFEGARFEGKADFEEAEFEREAHFPKAIFQGPALFRDAVFRRYAHFPDATFENKAEFLGADLKAGFRLGPTLVAGKLVLDNASLGDADMRVSTCLFSCQKTRFHGPAHLKVRWAVIQLEEAVFDRVSTLAFLPTWEGPDEADLSCLEDVARRPSPRSRSAERRRDAAMPWLFSLSRADVGNLTLADIDLSLCDFDSTLRLDEMRLATLCPFDEVPAAPLVEAPLVRLLPRWTYRITIHEERCWRVSSPKFKGWTDWTDTPSKPCTEPTSLVGEAERLAKIYRALRKGREDEGNAPGAGDFYYGEMEMRRHAAGSRAEHAVIWLYWLVSGYGLRASRALLALCLTVLLFAALFSLGIRDESAPDNLVFSLQSTINLLRAPQEDLPIEGRLLEIGLRLLGPLFFGLALLSLRGRVKR